MSKIQKTGEVNHVNKFFRLDFPLERVHCGIPLGNGNMGVLAWGGGNRLCLTVNRADFWDHRGGQFLMEGNSYSKLIESVDPNDASAVERSFVCKNFPDHVNAPMRLPVGRFEFILEDHRTLSCAELVYESGELIIRTNKGGSIRLSLGIKNNLLYVEDTGSIIKDVTVKPSWDIEKSRKWLSHLAFKAPETVNEKDRKGWIQACPEDSSLASICWKYKSGFLISLELGENNETAFNKALSSMDKISGSIQDFTRENSEWWGNFWKDIPEINLPGSFYSQFFRYAVYKFAAATNPGRGIACGLQGPWVEEYQNAQWSSDYHFNVNIQQIYTLAFGIGAYNHLLPLFDMLESEPFQKVMHENAKNLLGIDDGLLLTHAVDDRGMQCGGISVGATLDFACGGWVAKLYWLYYKHTLDKAFLKNRAYPFIKGAMRVYEATLEEYKGRLSLPLSISAEYSASFLRKDGSTDTRNYGRDPSNQLICIHMLADMLIEASAILGHEPETVWLDIKRRLPEYTIVGDLGCERIGLWEGQDLDVCHRHHSHLAEIYPFETLSCPTPEQQQIIDNTIDHWISRGMGEWSEWCYPWAAIIQARLGFKEAPALLLNIWKEVFINEAWATVYLPRFRGLSSHRRADMLNPKESSEIMQLDGTMAGATAILEMLVHQRGDTVFLFPGIPDAWRDLSFRSIHLPSGFSIGAERRQGKLTLLSVESRMGGRLKISLEGHVQEYHFEPGEIKIIPRDKI